MLDELLTEFFEFYADFDFTRHGVSVVTGTLVDKPDSSVPVYIENPVERELNVSKNVLEEHLQNFQTQCRLTRDTLRQTSTIPRSRSIGDHWGLLSILKTDDQLLLLEDQVQTQTMSDDDADHIQRDMGNSDNVGQTLQPASVDIHEILHDDGDKLADNVSTRTL